MAELRVILQQCLSARLQVQPASEEVEAQWVEVGRGILIYICFLKGSSLENIPKVVKSILNVKLSEGSDVGKNVSVLELPGDILIIPQATLGGKMKGKNVQYHSNIAKEDGLKLYEEFIFHCKVQQIGKVPGISIPKLSPQLTFDPVTVTRFWSCMPLGYIQGPVVYQA